MLNWKTARHGAAKNLVDVACGTPEDIGYIDPIGDQAAAFREISEWIDRGQHMSYRQRSNQVAMIGHEDIGHDDEAAVRATGNRRDRIFDLRGVADHRTYRVNPKGPRGGFNRWEISCSATRGRCRIEQQRHSCEPWRKFLEKFDPLGAHRGFENGESGDISAWFCQRCNQAAPDRIGNHSKYDWYRAGLARERSRTGA